MRKCILLPAGVVLAFGMCGVLAHYCQPKVATSSHFTPDELASARESIAISLMGQVQFTVGSLVWLKTLEYLHNGVAYRMPTETEEQKGVCARAACDVHSGLQHKDGIAMTLTPSTDWRGPVGDLQRQIQPYMEVPRHSDPVELIPWYELTLKMNPNLERLYVLGAFFIAENAGEPSRARALLENGIDANPWTFEIRAALGRLLHDYHGKMKIEPEVAYRRASDILERAIEQAGAERERLDTWNRANPNRDPETFDPYQEQLLGESYLFRAKSLTVLGRYDEALAVCDAGMTAVKDLQTRSFVRKQ
ncbi:MAG: hypothetical protein GY851_14440, partial [bacterium]|nr:hypothetical protein [bacterium]